MAICLKNDSSVIKESKAIQLDKDEDNIIGDIVIYYVDGNGNGLYDEGEEIIHSAVVIKVDQQGFTTRVISKMGEDSISDHHPDNSVYYETNNKGLKTSRAYFRKPDNNTNN